MFRKHYRESIRYKFLKDISIILFASTCVLSTVIAINEGKMLKHSLMTKGQSILSTIAKLSEDALIMKDSIQLDAIVNGANKDEDIIYIIFQDAQGKLITSQYASINYQSPRLKVMLSGLSKESELPDIIAAIKKKEAITELSLPILTGTDTIGTVTICMSQHNIRKQIVKTILFVIALNLVVTFVLGAMLFIASKKTILDPIIELGHAATRLAKGDLSAQVKIKTTGEIQMLVNSFNQMAEDLEKTTVSKDYVDNIIKSMINTLIVASPEGEIIRVNAAACSLLGYEERELIGQPLRMIIYDEFGKDSVLNDVTKNGFIGNIEETYLSKDGRKIPVLFSASAMRDENDHCIQGIVCVAQDITDRKRAEEALLNAAQQWRATFDGIGDIVCLLDPEGKILKCNRALTNFLAKPFSDILNRPYWEIIHSTTAPIKESPVEFMKETRRREIAILPIGDRWFNIVGDPLLNEAGSLIGAVYIMSDITEQKRAEEALRQSEEKYRTILENMQDGYFEVDLSGNFTFANEAQCRNLGYTRQELIGMNNRQCADETNARKLYQTFNGVYRTGEPVKVLDVDVIRKDGTKAVNEISVSLMRGPEGKPIGFRGVTRDVAERKRADEAVKRLSQENAVMAEIGRVISSTLNIEEVYERFAEEVRKLISFDRIIINTLNPKDNTTTVAYATGIDVESRRVADIFPLVGSVTEECIRMQSSLLFQPESIEEGVNRFPLLLVTLKAGLRSMIFVPLVSEDQVIGVLSLQTTQPNAYTESDLKLAERVSNQIAGAIANATLYAERKQMEDALRKSEERFRELFDNAPLGYHEYDAEGRLTNVNRTDLEMLGYTAEEMIGQQIWKFNVEGDTLREQVLAKLAGTSPPGRNLERIYRRKDGTTIPVLVEDRLILDEKAQIKGIRCTIQDITARKRAEEEKESLREQLRQSQKIEAIGKLAGGVAHDFNNLLTVIHGYGELLLNGLHQENRLKQDVQEIINASERASSLTRQLLAFSRKQVLQPKVLDLNAHVSNMDKMLRRMIGEDVELVTLLTKDLGRIKADPGQIEQAILNLAVNAKDAMLNGGKLTIETANAKLDENYARSRVGVPPGDYVMLSMSDTGVGMAPETKERIFEPFFTTKEKGKGTGLGLSTVYGIVQQSGGNIWVYSEPGLGTTFKIYLPTIEGDTESLRPAPIPTRLLQGSETILLVEDEEMVRKLAYTVLQRNGYKVLEASNGNEALDVVQGRNGNPIHLVVTDVVMPGMSGRQLADRLASLRPEIKILYMSGYTDDAIVHHGVLDPGIAYIQKPFTPDALASKVREILDGH